MKNYLIVLVCTMMLVFCVGCTDENIIKGKALSNESSTVFDICESQKTDNEKSFIETDTTVMYHISEPDSYILIPKEYALFSRDIDEASDALKSFALSKENIVSYLDAYGSEFLAVSPDGNMEIMLKFQKTGLGFKDLIYQNDSVISGYAEGLQTGIGAKKYELVKQTNIMWVKLAYSQPISGSTVPADVVRYATVVNGWDIFLWGSSYSGKLTQRNLQELQNMQNSFILAAD